MKRLTTAVGVTTVFLLAFAPRGDAAFPGTNGPIAFEAGQPAAPAIATVAPDGSGRDQLSGKLRQRDPSWAPDGRRLAFTQISPDGDDDIYVREADGTTHPVAPSPASDTDPAFSPDGRRIAFTSRRSGDAEIYVADLDAPIDAAPQRLTNLAGPDQQPAWSVNDEIAFSSARAGELDIWIMDAGGEAIRRMTTAPGKDADASWSPDGERLAYTTGDYRIGILPRLGGAPEKLLAPSGVHFPAWSPDGRRLAYTMVYGPPLLHHIAAPTADGSGSADTSGVDLRPLLSEGVDPNWGPLPRPPDGDPEAPPQGVGEITVSGSDGVRIGPEARRAVSPLEGPVVVPVESAFNAIAGTVTLVAPAAGEPIEATVSGGRFRTRLRDDRSDPLVLRLRAPRGICSRRARAARRHRKTTRLESKGPVRAVPRHGSGSSGGTTWTITQLCGRTRYAVQDGVVVVTDERGRDHVLRPGGRSSFTVRARRR